MIRTRDTSDDTFNSLVEVAKKMGKAPVACVDSPGCAYASHWVAKG